ncbi:MAG: acetate--CoA ligase family protein [Candidatus Hydrothermarchaeales archaeon]
MTGEEIIAKARDAKRNVLTVDESKDLLNAYGVQINKSFLARDVDEAIKNGRETGFPVVMKIVSPEIIHKTDVGGVQVNIKDEEELEDTYKRMIESARSHFPNANIEGILIEEMVQGTEMIVGISKDPTFGHLIMFGMGGVFVEVFKDVSFRVVPIEKEDALEMIEETKGKAIIEGARGNPIIDKEKIADVMLKVSNLIMDHPEVEEMDINPLMGNSSEVVAVDARFLIAT